MRFKPQSTEACTNLAIGEAFGRKVLAASSYSMNVYLWDIDDGTPIGKGLVGHSGYVNAVAFGKVNDKPNLFSVGGDGLLISWSLEKIPKGAKRPEYKTGDMNLLAWYEVNKKPRLAATDENFVRVYDIATGQQVGKPLTGHTEHVLSVTFCTVDGRPVLASGSKDKTIRLWDCVTHRPLDVLEGHRDWVNYLAFIDVDGAPTLVSGGDDGSVRVWNLKSRGKPKKLKSGRKGYFRVVAVGNLDGVPMAFGGRENGKIYGWDLMTRMPLWTPFKAHSTYIRALTLHKCLDKWVLASGSDAGDIKFWDPQTCEPLGAPWRELKIATDGGYLYKILFPTLEKVPTLLANDGQTLRRWVIDRLDSGGQRFGPYPQRERIEIGSPLQHSAYGGEIADIAIGVLGEMELAATCDDDYRIRLLNLLGHPRQSCEPFESYFWGRYPVAFSQLKEEGEILRVDSRGRILRHDSVSGRRLPRTPKADCRNWVTALAYGETDSKPVRIIASKGMIKLISDVGRGEKGVTVLRTKGSDAMVRCVATGNVNGKNVIASGGNDNLVRIWDVSSGSEIGSGIKHCCHVLSIVFGHREERSVIATGDGEGEVRLFDAEDKKLLWRAYGNWAAHEDWVNCLAIGEVGGVRLLASGGGDGRVSLWMITNGRIYGRPINAHSSFVASVSLGEVYGVPTMVTCGDKTIKIWDPLRCTLHQTIPIGCDAHSLAMDPKGTLAVTCDRGLLTFDIGVKAIQERMRYENG